MNNLYEIRNRVDGQEIERLQLFSTFQRLSQNNLDNFFSNSLRPVDCRSHKSSSSIHESSKNINFPFRNNNGLEDSEQSFRMPSIGEDKSFNPMTEKRQTL